MLPPYSATWAALLDDEDWARAAIAQDEIPEPSGPSLRDWTPQVTKTADLEDRMSEVIVALSQGRAQFHPARRPRTAFDRLLRQARKERERRETDDFLASITWT